MSFSPPDLLVVTGLQREAQIAAGDGVDDRLQRRQPQRAVAMAGGYRAATRRRPQLWIGRGLAPDLRSGDVVLASHVFEQSERHDVHDVWHSTILSASQSTMRVRHGAITGHDVVIARAADKAALHAGSGAVAVDMESHIAALYARKHGLPFAIIRVISDPVTRSLPPVASDALKPDGNIDMSKILKGIARNPGQATGADRSRFRLRARFQVVTPRPRSSWPALRPPPSASLTASSEPATRRRTGPDAAYPWQFPVPSVPRCGRHAATPTTP